MSGEREARKHRCMRCGDEFDCTAPGCVALYDVLPTMIRGGVVVEHECRKEEANSGEAKPAPRIANYAAGSFIRQAPHKAIRDDAAPDLYAALIGVLTPGHSADCGPGGGCPLCTAARVAIAKAEGK